MTVCFLSLRFLGFLRGTGIKMATFILMMQDICANIQVFLVVLMLILLMFACMYHILLTGSDIDDDEWRLFGTSLWKVWGFSLGEVDDSAIPTVQAYYLFTAFGLILVIIMMYATNQVEYKYRSFFSLWARSIAHSPGFVLYSSTFEPVVDNFL